MNKTVNIGIGEYHASKSAVRIHTLLGSCVAVCLFDSHKKIGGMNHIFLPGRANFNNFNTPARYGINAMELLINDMVKLGADRERLTAKVFGGGNVLPMFSKERSIGKQIAEFVLDFLERENIPVTAGDLGGDTARKIFQHTHTNEVYVRRIPVMSYRKNAERNKIIYDRIEKAMKKMTDVTLFN